MTNYILSSLLLLLAASAIVIESAERACGNSEPPIGAGVVASPNYPQNYDNNANCVHLLQADQTSPGAIIQLSFGPFATEECCDLLYIYDGPSVRSPLIRRISGAIIGKRIFFSTQPYMTLNFVSDQTTTMAGFTANYSTAMLPSKPAECPNSLGYPINMGTVTSPSYPAMYSNDQDCLYFLEASANRTLRLTFTNYSVEDLYDFVTVYNGPSTVSPVLGNSSSTRPCNPCNSSQQFMTIRFKSDSSIVAAGFSANYVMV